MKTYSVKQADIQKKWILIDAAGKHVGRLSTEIARILRGKHKATFTPHLDCGDNVIVVNASKVVFTGRKWSQKNYNWHSGYSGGIKGATAREMLERRPERILAHAVKGMLPKNKLGKLVAGHLKIYSGEEHPHEAQKPVSAAPRLAGRD